METLTYNRQVFMPSEVSSMGSVEIRLNPTAHALYAAQRDRYGAFQIPETIAFYGRDVVEVETVAGKISKLVVRIALDEKQDAIYVFMVPCGTLKTVWLNMKEDKHKTLDERPFQKDGRLWRKK